MSHTAILALMQNQSLINHLEILENIQQGSEYLKVLLKEIFIIYTAIFGKNHFLAIALYLIVFYHIRNMYYYATQLQELEDQIQYLKKKTRYQEGNLEYIFDYKANNEMKLNKLTKQMKKLQKEINEYA